jgi:hypothetical protein
MNPRCLQAAALSVGLTWGSPPAVDQPSVALFSLVQSMLRGGESVGLVVERQDLRASGATASTSPGVQPSLEGLQAAGTNWQVSTGAVRRVSRRVRPREVDELLATLVRVPATTLSVGRAIFIVPRVAVHGTLTGVAGGGVTSSACGLEREIRGDERARPLAPFLDETVAQVPGIAWVLTWNAANPRDTLSLGVMCPDGSMSLLEMAAPR